MSDAAHTNGHDDADRDAEAAPAEPEDSGRAGRVGSALGGTLATIPKALPIIRESLFKRMAIKSVENYHKAAGGDAIAINGKAGQQIDLEPILYRSPEEVEEGEKPGWTVKGREKSWHPGTEGYTVNYLGRTPTVLLEDDDHVEAGWLAPRISEAIELDNYWPLFVDADINAVINHQASAGAGAGGRARADGGMGVELELDAPGQFAGDNIVDLNSGPGYDGMRISLKKAREWQQETTDSEHMQMQEDRGFLRGLANADSGPGIVKLLLICAAIILGTLAIVLLGPKVIGGGGGGGGINPLLASWALLGGV
jgi:hypothetical protein